MMKNERKRTFLLITLPILALFICFNTVPLIRGVVYSFTNFKGFGTFDWVGLRNYIDLFQDSRVGGSYLFTFSGDPAVSSMFWRPWRQPDISRARHSHIR